MIGLLALLWGCPPPAAPVEAPVAQQERMIVFADLDAGTEHEEAASTLPDTMAWVDVAGERVAVARIESRSMPGGGREIKKLDATGRVLETTIAPPHR